MRRTPCGWPSRSTSHPGRGDEAVAAGDAGDHGVRAEDPRAVGGVKDGRVVLGGGLGGGGEGSRGGEAGRGGGHGSREVDGRGRTDGGVGGGFSGQGADAGDLVGVEVEIAILVLAPRKNR